MNTLSPFDLLQSIQATPNGLTLSDLLQLHPSVARRTAQRWISQLIEQGQITVTGQRRSSRYFATSKLNLAHQDQDSFPDYIPVSADSRDILIYINQPVEARKPVYYQCDFLESYQPNHTYYLSESLRRQLKQMGNTGKTQLPAGTYGREIFNRFLIDLSWASSHLEGNTYSRLDTLELIEHGKVAEGKNLIETQMILNHKRAIELLIDNADTVGFNRYTIFNIHSLLSENLLANREDEGRNRLHPVSIGKSTYRPLSVPSQLSEMLDLILNKTSEIQDPFEQSFFMMVHLPYLQPFIDINKRTSRLMANVSLIQANLCPLTFLDVPEQAYTRAILGVYELNRVELLRDLYVWAYGRSTQEYLTIQQNMAEPEPLRLIYRELIKKIIHQVITHPEQDSYLIIKNFDHPDIQKVDSLVPLIIEELRQIHEGALARYGLKLSEFQRWKKHQSI